MSPRVKQVLLIGLLLLVAGLIAYAIYFIGFSRRGVVPVEEVATNGSQTPVVIPRTGGPRTTPSGGVVTGNEPTTGGQNGVEPSSSASSGGIYYQPTAVTRLTSTTPTYLSISQSGQARFHDIASGKFYRVLPDGSVKKLSDQIFYGVQNVTWAKDSNKAVIEYPDNFKTIYNFDTQKQVTLPSHWKDFSFSPDGSQIVAKSVGLSRENRWLVTVRDDGSGTRLIEPLGDNADEVTVSWSPSRQTVAFSQTGDPIGYERRQILLIGLNGENFKPVTIEGLDFLPQWSPTGKRLLYSVDSARTDFKPELWITDAYGDSIDNNRQSLKIATWADKCVFGGDDVTLFCAIPRDLPSGAALSRDVARGAIDDIYKIDLKTGARSVVPLDGKEYSVTAIDFDKTSNRLIFTDESKTGIFQAKL
jgi:hypothetical protein